MYERYTSPEVDTILLYTESGFANSDGNMENPENGKEYGWD